MEQGREAVVRFSNSGPTNMSVHVHGQYNRAPFDGWAADYATTGQYKDYYYPNTQNARTIWYHVSKNNRPLSIILAQVASFQGV